MVVVIGTQKFDPPAAVELKFVFFVIMSPNFIGNQNICIPTMAESLAIKKSIRTGTTFALKFVCFWIN